MSPQLSLNRFVLNPKFISYRTIFYLFHNFRKYVNKKFNHLVCTNQVCLDHMFLTNNIRLETFCLNSMHIYLPMWTFLLEYDSTTQLILDLAILNQHKIELLIRQNTCQRHNSKPKSNYIEFISYHQSMHPKRFHLPFNTHRLPLCPCLTYSKSYLYYSLLKFIILSEPSEIIQLQKSINCSFRQCKEKFTSTVTKIQITKQQKNFFPLYLDGDYLISLNHITSLTVITDKPLIIIPS